MARDAAQPGAEVPAPDVLAVVRVRLDEGRLQQVFRAVVVGRQPEAVAVEPADERAHLRLEASPTARRVEIGAHGRRGQAGVG